MSRVLYHQWIVSLRSYNTEKCLVISPYCYIEIDWDTVLNLLTIINLWSKNVKINQLWEINIYIPVAFSTPRPPLICLQHNECLFLIIWISLVRVRSYPGYTGIKNNFLAAVIVLCTLYKNQYYTWWWFHKFLG